jgi:transposase InsO family protein
LKAIRSDNGTKFSNASFDQFCLEYSVDQQFSALHVPKQNGVVEWKMLDEHRTLQHFWADAISTICYISN